MLNSYEFPSQGRMQEQFGRKAKLAHRITTEAESLWPAGNRRTQNCRAIEVIEDDEARQAECQRCHKQCQLEPPLLLEIRENLACWYWVCLHRTQDLISQSEPQVKRTTARLLARFAHPLGGREHQRHGVHVLRLDLAGGNTEMG